VSVELVKRRPDYAWKGKCAVGVYPGERRFPDGTVSRGVFGMVGVVPDCPFPVTARCQYMLDGHLLPYWWLACDNPEHRRDAGVIQHLDPEGYVVRIEKIRPLVQAPVDEIRYLPEAPKKRVSKNKGNKARRRAEKL